ncbi:MAG: helix-turn-helix domain-containing protein [Silvibacterium sp.]|nr:helix-turn-helix domain-containing protein [Silvibacterium sp.]
MDLIEELRTRQSYLSTEEVMQLIQKTRNTLCQWVRRGYFPAIRVGKEYLYDPRLVADWLARRQTGHPSGSYSNSPKAAGRNY